MITQEAIADLERVKAELAQSIQRKEREFGAIMAKIEDEGSLGTKQQKQIKELSVSIFPNGPKDPTFDAFLSDNTFKNKS